MAESPGTRPSLLLRLRDGADADAWRDFVGLYGPMIHRFARKRGLQEADADDLGQIVLQAVAAGIGRFEYDPGRGTFRSWLFTLVRNQLARFLHRQERVPQGSGDTAAQERLAEQPAPEDSALWEQEFRRQRFLWAAERVKADFEHASWQAFWLTAVDGRNAAVVAGELGLSVGAVYTAKSRVFDRIKKMIRTLD